MPRACLVVFYHLKHVNGSFKLQGLDNNDTKSFTSNAATNKHELLIVIRVNMRKVYFLIFTTGLKSRIVRVE